MGADEALRETRTVLEMESREAGLTEPPPERERGERARVMELLPNATAEVELQNRVRVLAHFAGATRRNFVRVRVGDTVLVELTPHDKTRGRIVKLLPRS